MSKPFHLSRSELEAFSKLPFNGEADDSDGHRGIRRQVDLYLTCQFVLLLALLTITFLFWESILPDICAVTNLTRSEAVHLLLLKIVGAALLYAGVLVSRLLNRFFLHVSSIVLVIGCYDFIKDIYMVSQNTGGFQNYSIWFVLLLNLSLLLLLMRTNYLLHRGLGNS